MKKLKSYVRTRFYRILDGYFVARQDQSKAQLEEVIRQEIESSGLNQSIYDTSQILDIVKANRDNIYPLRNRLSEVRLSREYAAALKAKNPLITVRIATYNNAEVLATRTLPSILNQTYQNFEVIIIGDHCTDDTEERLAALKDNRIKFINLPVRSIYPDDSEKRWMVAGSPGMNLGADLAQGDWIAPLDDDDEFTPDHLERLLALAHSSQAELVYGKLIQFHTHTQKGYEVYNFPPIHGQFSFQGALYMRLLNFFQYDTQSWVVHEPGDWNLCRRMLLAGVRVAGTDAVVGTMYFTPKEHHIQNGL